MVRSSVSFRRSQPRVAVESLCSELYDEALRHALVVDLSEDGLRLQRPLGGPRARTLQLEVEIPGVDEIIWATGHICFDEVWNVPPANDGSLSGLVRTSGVRLVTAAARHQRLLREYVLDTWRQQRREYDVHDCLTGASCYLRG